MVKYIISGVFLIAFFGIKAQGSFTGCEHWYEVSNDTLIIYQRVTFNLGDGTDCPPIDSVAFKTVDDTLKLTVRYDDRGGWAAASCARTDVLPFKVPLNTYTLIVNAWLYGSEDPETGEYENVHVDSDTTYMVKVSVAEQQNLPKPIIGVFPNPANTLVQFKVPKHVNLENISLYDLLGRSILDEKPRHNQLDVSSLPKGQYILRLNTSNGVQVEQLMVE